MTEKFNPKRDRQVWIQRGAGAHVHPFLGQIILKVPLISLSMPKNLGGKPPNPHAPPFSNPGSAPDITPHEVL